MPNSQLLDFKYFTKIIFKIIKALHIERIVSYKNVFINFTTLTIVIEGAAFNAWRTGSVFLLLVVRISYVLLNEHHA